MRANIGKVTEKCAILGALKEGRVSLQGNCHAKTCLFTVRFIPGPGGILRYRDPPERTRYQREATGPDRALQPAGRNSPVQGAGIGGQFIRKLNLVFTRFIISVP